MNVSLIWICFLFEWTYPLPFLPHFLRPDLHERWVMISVVTSISFWNDSRLNNTLASGCRTSYSAIFQKHMHRSSLTCLGYRTWYEFLLWNICSLLCWVDGVSFQHSLVVGLRLLWDLQFVPWVPVLVVWVSRCWCWGPFLDLVWLAPPLSLMLPGNCGDSLVGTDFCCYHQYPYLILWSRHLP